MKKIVRTDVVGGLRTTVPRCYHRNSQWGGGELRMHRRGKKKNLLGGKIGSVRWAPQQNEKTYSLGGVCLRATFQTQLLNNRALLLGDLVGGKSRGLIRGKWSACAFSVVEIQGGKRPRQSNNRSRQKTVGREKARTICCFRGVRDMTIGGGESRIQETCRNLSSPFPKVW